MRLMSRRIKPSGFSFQLQPLVPCRLERHPYLYLSHVCALPSTGAPSAAGCTRRRGELVLESVAVMWCSDTSSVLHISLYVDMQFPQGGCGAGFLPGVEDGEDVSWELLDRKEFHLVRAAPPPVNRRARRNPCSPATTDVSTSSPSTAVSPSPPCSSSEQTGFGHP